MDINRVLNFSSNAGRAMLQSGGETYRVEETISSICQAFNVDDVDVFATPTAVMVSVSIEGKIHSIVKRIKSRGINLNRVHNINSLSRKISVEKLSIEECERELEIICIDDSYDTEKILVASGIASSAFTMLFGGEINSIIVSFLVGIITKLIFMSLSKSSLNEFFINSICGAIIAIFSIILLKIGIIREIDKLIAGCIMLLVPGLALTNSIRDIIEGQLISGLTKAAEAFLVAVSIAVGTGAVIHLYLTMGGI
ncbi:threonine/serine ThrE exporter family protein [Romboutsia lituseburensis]|uniref:threonine/serine ThrE exporter family protein n=1 Tax=Romboutsia lituseburensis TaxID=1537 RepID=UPI00215A2AFE|nr:threonine/serine exporter family protein [Romboutsia lituseburensis]MCR8744934.1 threonine/serine exporter family protein [Romboutsia lituseburensis]